MVNDSKLDDSMQSQIFNDWRQSCNQVLLNETQGYLDVNPSNSSAAEPSHNEKTWQILSRVVEVSDGRLVRLVWS